MMSGSFLNMLTPCFGAKSLRVGDCEAAASWACHRQPRETFWGTRRSHPFRLSGLARPPTSCQHFKPEMPGKLLQLGFPLRSRMDGGPLWTRWPAVSTWGLFPENVPLRPLPRSPRKAPLKCLACRFWLFRPQDTSRGGVRQGFFYLGWIV